MDRIVCTPILSFIVLLKILFSNKNKSSIIYFELFPFYLRFIIKFFSVPEETIINFFKIIFKIELKKIKHGDEIENYNNIRLNTYNNITNLFDSLLKIINKSDAYFLLNNLIDKDSTKSSIIKYFSKNQMHLYLLSGIICDNISKNKVDLFVPNHWDKFILNEISKNKFFSNISLKKEPYILSIFQILNSNIKIIFYLIRSIFIHGIKFNSIKKKSPKISTEIFDPNLIGSSGVFDSDFFVDNINFKYENSLFYVTKNNYNIFKKNGGDKKKFIDILDKKNIDLIFLQNLSIGYKKYFCMFSFYFKFLISSLKFKSDFILTVYPHIFRDYIDYLPLFENYDIKNHIHLINSNGRGPLLLNSGVITGICRDYKTKSIGIQNRLIDAKHYEFSYDCYDVYFLWGDAWIKLLNSTLIFIKKVKLSGVINISENTLIKNKLLNTKKNNLNNSLKNVLVFPTDINLDTSVYSGNYYSFNYFYSFIKACLFIASHYPKINFFCKLKDLEHINLFNKNDKLINLNINKYPNFKLVSNPRMEYINLLIKSDLAICIGFTSPGIDSILLGKKTLYYSKLFNAGDALKEIPYLVNNSKKELLSSFKNLVKKNNNFQLLYSKKIDPYNDGKAIKRIVKYITKNN